MSVTFLRSPALLRPRYWAAALAVGGAALLSGCAYDDGYYGGYGGYDYGYDRTVVYDRYGYPPPARVEYRTTAPSSRHVWVNGDWRWSGSRYQWAPGRWEQPGHHIGHQPRPPQMRPEPQRPPQMRPEYNRPPPSQMRPDRPDRPEQRPDRPRPPEQARPDRPQPLQAQHPRPRPEQSRPSRTQPAQRGDGEATGGWQRRYD